MPTLRIVPDTNDPARIGTLTGSEAGGIEDRVACMLKYLRSLEQVAEQSHGDNEDWRYGRYLFHGMLVAALKSVDQKSV